MNQQCQKNYETGRIFFLITKPFMRSNPKTKKGAQ